MDGCIGCSDWNNGLDEASGGVCDVVGWRGVMMFIGVVGREDPNFCCEGWIGA